MNSALRRVLGPTAALGALAAAVAVAAPNAAATITSLDISPGLSFGSSTSYGVGCTYTISVTAKPNTSISLFDQNTDNNPPAGYWTNFSPLGIVTDATGKGSTTWYPAWKGLHTITAQEFGSDQPFTITATAGTGTKLGPACIVSA
ncbi:hypothetical protein JMUB6875_71470 [Nocardia sp. JMUB6875]|uniref:hypothetical protein n=1 Tax=Nocardia sp. JMUB6875 TaxID=3158170 RepID=UPI0032E71330